MDRSGFPYGMLEEHEGVSRMWLNEGGGILAPGHPSARRLALTLPPLRNQQREHPLETAVLPVFN